VVRKEKKTHGLQRLVEGPYVVGRRVLVVEDVSTTGSSILQAVNGLNDAGAIIVGAAILLDRGGQKIVEATGLPCRSLYNLEDILRTGPYVDSV
jgi:orotate phosphoribosyltransferase